MALKESRKRNAEFIAVMRKAYKATGLTIPKLADKLGLTRFQFRNMLTGSAGSIQKDAALRLARITKMNPSEFQPYLSKRAPHGSRKKKLKKKLEIQANTFQVACPHCSGEGTILVRKV